MGDDQARGAKVQQSPDKNETQSNCELIQGSKHKNLIENKHKLEVYRKKELNFSQILKIEAAYMNKNSNQKLQPCLDQ